jgi:glycolate oxidase iron-sulfur subunit
MDLHLDADELNTCVQCGLCLPHCPTFRVTGDETMSPRGRIALMRHVQDNDAPVTDEVVDAFATCVQCRGCEPACPSSVPYGRLIEQTRETLVDMGKLTPSWQQAALKPLASPKLLRAGSAALGVLNKVGLVPDRLGLPTDIPIRQEPLVASGTDVWMFTGCVMDAWQRDVHHATQRVLEAAGFGVQPTSDAAPCCGALQAHAGMGDESRSRAEQVIGALGDKPILVNSAGCGAAMKDYGHLLGTDAANEFSARVFDISEFLADHVDALPAVEPLDLRVAVQDP